MHGSAFIAGYVRTPFTSAKKGGLAGVRPDALGAHAIRALLERTGVPGEDVEDVLWGCAFPGGGTGTQSRTRRWLARGAAAEFRRRHRQPLVRLLDPGRPGRGRDDPDGRRRRVRSGRDRVDVARADDGLQRHASSVLERGGGPGLRQRWSDRRARRRAIWFVAQGPGGVCPQEPGEGDESAKGRQARG